MIIQALAFYLFAIVAGPRSVAHDLQSLQTGEVVTLLKGLWLWLVVDGHRFHFRHYGSRTSSAGAHGANSLFDGKSFSRRISLCQRPAHGRTPGAAAFLGNASSIGAFRTP